MIDHAYSVFLIYFVTYFSKQSMSICTRVYYKDVNWQSWYLTHGRVRLCCRESLQIIEVYFNPNWWEHLGRSSLTLKGWFDSGCTRRGHVSVCSCSIFTRFQIFSITVLDFDILYVFKKRTWTLLRLSVSNSDSKIRKSLFFSISTSTLQL